MDASSASWRLAHREYRAFTSRTPVLYEHIANIGLTWPSLTVQWMDEPDHTPQTQQPTQPPQRSTAAKKNNRRHPTDDQEEAPNTSLRDAHLLIGTHTSGNFPNSVQLARLRLPDARTFDPLQELLAHPLLVPLHDSRMNGAPASPGRRTSRSTANRKQRRAAAAAAALAPLPTAAPAEDYSARLPCFGSTSSFDIIGRLRTQHELHRIRPLLMQSSLLRNLSASRLMQPAHEANIKQERDEAMDESPSNGVHSNGTAVTPTHSSIYTRGLFATKGPEGDVNLYDIGKAKRIHTVGAPEEDASISRKRSFGGAPSKKDNDSTPLLTLTGHATGGWPLDWNCNPEAPVGVLVSADNDGSICVWHLDDAQTAAAVAPTTPLTAASRNNSSHTRLAARHTWATAHDCVINDISWQRLGNCDTLFSVGDDCQLKQWDTRTTAPVHVVRVHDDQVSSISSAPHREFELLTASKDRTIRLWDTRQLTSGIPLHTFVGHGDEVLQVAWAPFKHHDGSVFASSSADRRVFIWDASLRDAAITEADLHESGSPELLFVHAGHTERVEDFSWHPTRDWLMASVGEENVVQVWEINAALHQDFDKQDRAAFDTITEILQNQAPELVDSRLPFDIERIMATMPTELLSTVLTDTTLTPLRQSAHLNRVADFVRPYAETIDAQLTEQARTVSIPILDSSEEVDASDISSVADSDLVHRSRSVSASPPRKKPRVLGAAVKVKSEALTSPESKPAPPSRRPILSVTSHSGSPHLPIVMDVALAHDLRTLKHWDTKRKEATPGSATAKLANKEFEAALQQVLARAPATPPPSPTRAASRNSDDSGSSSCSSSSSHEDGSDSSLSSDDEYLLAQAPPPAPRLESNHAEPPTSKGRTAKRAPPAAASKGAKATSNGAS